MKYVIAKNLKVSFKGEFSSPNTDEGQFLFDTETDSQLTKATLIGMADSNNVEIGKRDNIATLVAKLDQNFSELKLKEVTKMSDENIAEGIVEGIVVAGVEAGTDEDTMLVSIVNAGVGFKNAMKMFHSVMESKGLRISAKKRADKIAELIAELNFQPENSDDVKTMVDSISENVPATNNDQAYGALRRWAKKNEVSLPKMRGAKKASGGFRARVEDYMIANPLATSEEFKIWMTTEDGGNTDEKVANRFLGWFDVAKKMADTIAAMPAEEESEAA